MDAKLDVKLANEQFGEVFKYLTGMTIEQAAKKFIAQLVDDERNERKARKRKRYWRIYARHAALRK